MQRFVAKHRGKALIVVGTGPSAWKFTSKPAICKLLNKYTLIGINRAFSLPIKLTYQISLDEIWQILRNREPESRKSYNKISAVFQQWKQLRGRSVAQWSLEDFVAAYGSQLEVDAELLKYFKLCSPHAPFVRFAPSGFTTTCPYDAVHFQRQVGTPTKVYRGLYHSANTAHSAIHLAVVMGAKVVFLLGVDMAPPKRDERSWERGKYDTDAVMLGFRVLRSAFNDLRIVNLNPQARLQAFERATDVRNAIHLLKQHLPIADGHPVRLLRHTNRA